MKKYKILLIIDAQNDFIDGSLRNEEAIKTVPYIVEKIKAFDGDEIIATLDTHFDDYLKTKEGKNLPVPHCIYQTDGIKLNKQIEDAINNTNIKHTYINKNTFGSILTYPRSYNESLPERIIRIFKEAHLNNGEFEIEMCGFCTDICVISNALILKAYFPEIANITVDAKGCAGLTVEKHNAALDVMESCQISIKNR